MSAILLAMLGAGLKTVGLTLGILFVAGTPPKNTGPEVRRIILAIGMFFIFVVMLYCTPVIF